MLNNDPYLFTELSQSLLQQNDTSIQDSSAPLTEIMNAQHSRVGKCQTYGGRVEYVEN